MKTASYLRIFVASVTMTAMACSEPDVKLSGGSSRSEYYTTVTTWNQGGDGTFVGLISNVPLIDLSRADVFLVTNGMRIPINRQPNSSNPPTHDLIKYQLMYNGYLWASGPNNVLLLNFVGHSATAKPPFPLDVIIVY